MVVDTEESIEPVFGGYLGDSKRMAEEVDYVIKTYHPKKIVLTAELQGRLYFGEIFGDSESTTKAERKFFERTQTNFVRHR